MQKSDFSKFAKRGCSPVNLPHIFRTPIPKNTSRGLLLSKIKELENRSVDLSTIYTF